MRKFLAVLLLGVCLCTSANAQGTVPVGGPETATNSDFSKGYWAEIGVVYVNGFNPDPNFYGYKYTLARSICTWNYYIGADYQEQTIESLLGSTLSPSLTDLFDTVENPWTNDYMTENYARVVVAFGPSSFGIYDGSLTVNASGNIVFSWGSYSSATFIDQWAPVPYWAQYLQNYTGPSLLEWVNDPFYPAFIAQYTGSPVPAPILAGGSSPYKPQTH